MSAQTTSSTLRAATEKLIAGQDLTYQESYDAIDAIMSGACSQIQTASFLSALSACSYPSETIDEICGCAAAMRDHATAVSYPDVLEIVGTGADHTNSFNISTCAALAAAGAGVKVAKHGNRAASSLCGTADCLEALGVKL